MKNNFFTQTKCDRCLGSLIGKPRQMSWFTKECLCPRCIKEEQRIKQKLEKQGIEISKLEGCGYIPSSNYESI